MNFALLSNVVFGIVSGFAICALTPADKWGFALAVGFGVSGALGLRDLAKSVDR